MRRSILLLQKLSEKLEFLRLLGKTRLGTGSMGWHREGGTRIIEEIKWIGLPGSVRMGRSETRKKGSDQFLFPVLSIAKHHWIKGQRRLRYGLSFLPVHSLPTQGNEKKREVELLAGSWMELLRITELS